MIGVIAGPPCDGSADCISNNIASGGVFEALLDGFVAEVVSSVAKVYRPRYEPAVASGEQIKLIATISRLRHVGFGARPERVLEPLDASFQSL